MHQNPRYIVGIDLGTTHTVAAYCRADQPDAGIELLTIPQLIAPGVVGSRPLLPSARYHPAEGEIDAADHFLPTPDGAVLGEAARQLGAKSQGRLVVSAKSWLTHSDADATAAILPWGGGEGVAKVSPLAASASYLNHIAQAWNQRFPDAPLAAQELVVTVPASFDEAARAYTLEAARQAGLPQVKLLEEPQAVCYDWLRRHRGRLTQELGHSRLLLVCDVGGGTTDLTLIQIGHAGGEPELTRIAVGDHLMLGGDNIDLTLARLAESRLRGDGKKLSAAEFSQLLEQCRAAKERLLAADAPEHIKLTLLGGGSRLIAASQSVELSRDEVRQIALEGFLPLLPVDALPDKKRAGMVEFGLPYVADPAIGKHIAAFLHAHSQAAAAALGENAFIPDALLLNGGVFNSLAIAQRLIDLIALWRGAPPRLLDNPHPDLAVAYGAVAYALSGRGRAPRIASGAARGYYLFIDAADASQRHGVCLLPKGSPEGAETVLDRQFALRVGQPARFHLLTLAGDSDHQAGDVVALDERFHSLPPLALALAGAANSQIQVRLAAAYTAIGVLQLQCIACDNPEQRWQVEFSLRKTAPAQAAPGLPPQFRQAAELLQAVFGAKSKQVNPQAVKTLRADLEKTLAAPRHEWPPNVLRELFGLLLAGGKYRRRGDAHERLWLSLAGFCLRPGYGYPLDDWRIEQLWRLYPEGLQFVTEKQNWTEWWTLWRRVAGGLDAAAQQRIYQDLAKYLNPASARQAGVAKQLATRGYEDMTRLAAALEQLPADDKTQLGGWLLQRLQKPGEPEQTYWALGRVGARLLFHAKAHHVLPPATVEPWLRQLLQIDWKKNPTAAFAAVLIARRCNDRARDLDDDLRLRTLEKLKSIKAPAAWTGMLETYQALDAQQEQQIFGEALPPGLRLL